MNLLGACVESPTFMLVTPLMHLGSLSNFLEDLRNKVEFMPDWTLRHIACRVLNGLCYLHSKDIIHRDLKPANILLHQDRETGNLHVRIAGFNPHNVKPQALKPILTDFGVSRILIDSTLTPGQGTLACNYQMLPLLRAIRLIFL